MGRELFALCPQFLCVLIFVDLDLADLSDRYFLARLYRESIFGKDVGRVKDQAGVKGICADRQRVIVLAYYDRFSIGNCKIAVHLCCYETSVGMHEGYRLMPFSNLLGQACHLLRIRPFSSKFCGKYHDGNLDQT